MKKFLFIILIVIIILLCYEIECIEKDIKTPYKIIENNIVEINKFEGVLNQEKPDISDWRLILVNYENVLPEDFEVNLSSIDKTRKFDSRAIGELKQMMQDMKKDGIQNVWVQSSYRSIEYQKKLFNKKVNTYMSQGKSREKAEELTLKKINKPGTSEHNLGLAVDFNYVDYDFDKTKGFEWLMQNAEKYGFILRYPKEKVEITKVDYEPWHWRYVGKEHAIKINELNMCLEEYVNNI